MKKIRLFSLSLMVLSGALLTSHLIADDVHVMDNPTGTSVKVESDGSKFVKDTDGTTVKVNPDGSKTIQKADGTTVQVNVDGSKTIKKADGTTIEVKPGQTVVE